MVAVAARLQKRKFGNLRRNKEVVGPEVNEFLPDVGAVVGVGVVGVHVLDGVEYTNWIEGIVVLQ
jgi:hypothetical protein